MSLNTQIPQIGAEMLLNYLYPELQDKWTVRHEGTFYRNYSRDVLSLDPENASVRVSRDGLLSLLPQGVFSQEEDLKKGNVASKHKELERQMRLLSEAFLPFDTFSFRRLLKAEQSVSELLNTKLEWLLKTYFGYDLAAENNPYVKEAAVLLPYISRRRGDFGLVRNLLESIFGCKVGMEERRYSEFDSTRCWVPMMHYELLIPDLSAMEFSNISKDLAPLTDFLERWFMPMEVKLDIVIRQHGVSPQMGAPLTLDYNTEL